jgi:hypothetical protein
MNERQPRFLTKERTIGILAALAAGILLAIALEYVLDSLSPAPTECRPEIERQGR